MASVLVKRSQRLSPQRHRVLQRRSGQAVGMSERCDDGAVAVNSSIGLPVAQARDVLATHTHTWQCVYVCVFVCLRGAI